MAKTVQSRRIFRSISAVVAGMLANIILSIGTDMALHAAGVFLAPGEPEMFTTPLLLLATAYRAARGKKKRSRPL